MAETNTSELEAINILLASIGEAPLNTISGDLPIDGTQAKNTLTEVSREVQSGSWHFNTFYDYTLSLDVNNKIPLAENIMRVDLDISKYSPSKYDVIKRGGYLFNKVDNTYIFTETLKALVVIFLPFTELPENARRYITIRASRIFQDRSLGANTLHKFQQQDELSALTLLRQEEADTGDHSIFNNYDTWSVINRGRVVK